MKEYTYLLNTPNDIPLALLLNEVSPSPLNIVLINFTAYDKYGWKKSKSLEPGIPSESINNIHKKFGDRMTICKSENQFHDLLKSCDVCLSRGREYFVLKCPSKRNIALSLNRCYFNRLLDVLPHYNNLEVFLTSPIWLDEKTCGRFMMDDGNNYGQIEKYKDRFKFVDIAGYNYDYLNNIGKESIKKKYSVPIDKKIAFLSFRMAQPGFSIHKTSDDFMKSTKKMLEYFKKQDYYIISRRRMGTQDLRYYQINDRPDMSRFNEVAHLIDLEMNGIEGFPGQAWEGLFVSDIHLLSDISGICYYEAALCRCPVYMPYENIDNVEDINPATRDMIRSGLIFNEYTKQNMDYYKNNIEKFIVKWYNTNVDLFWKIALK